MKGQPLTRAREVCPRPFLKWAGGKGQLLGPLIRHIEAAGAFRRYHEPFLGGGALFFELYRTGRLNPAGARLSDVNPRLMEAYTAIRDSVDDVIAHLIEHAKRHSKEYYYAVRARVPKSTNARAARLIYLNRTCFNGLYRENSQGAFNVPMGRYVNPRICDEQNLRAVAQALATTELATTSFDSVVEVAAPGDLVYFDPPYVPLSATSNFTAYEKSGFGEVEQRRLAQAFKTLAQRGVKVLLSNSDTELTRGLYGAFNVATEKATRLVNRRAEGRGAIDELIVSAF